MRRHYSLLAIVALVPVFLAVRLSRKIGGRNALYVGPGPRTDPAAFSFRQLTAEEWPPAPPPVVVTRAEDGTILWDGEPAPDKIQRGFAPTAWAKRHPDGGAP